MIASIASRMHIFDKLERPLAFSSTQKADSTGTSSQKGGLILSERQDSDSYGGSTFSLTEGVSYTRPSVGGQIGSTPGTGGSPQSEVIPFPDGRFTPAPRATSPAVPPAAAASNTASTLQRQNGLESSPADPIAVLRGALEQAGVNTAGYRFSYSADTVTYPGGSYPNRQVTVQTASGRTESYSADLMLRNPQVTVVEIQRLSRPA